MPYFMQVNLWMELILQHMTILKHVCASLKMSEYAVQATLKEFSLHVALLCKYMSDMCVIFFMFL
jgi:hypothetical protein